MVPSAHVETITAEAFPHGFMCPNCDRTLEPGDDCLWVPHLETAETIPVAMLAEAYANGMDPADIYVGFCLSCGEAI